MYILDFLVFSYRFSASWREEFDLLAETDSYNLSKFDIF